MGFNASQFRRVSWTHALVLGVALQALPLTACSGAAGTDVAQSGDTLKGGTPAGGKDKDKTNSGKHMGQAGAAAPGRDDAGVNEEKGNGQGQGAAGSKGEQGKGKGKQQAGASGSESHGKSDQARAGSHAQGPKAGHGADDDDMDDEADETDETP
jgi:hypothetical protein